MRQIVLSVANLLPTSNLLLISVATILAHMASPDDYCSACHDFDPQGPLYERDAVLRDTFGIHRVTLENRTPAELQQSRDACYRCAVLLAVAYKLATDWDKMTIWLEVQQNPRVSLIGKDACSFEIYVNGRHYFESLSYCMLS